MNPLRCAHSAANVFVVSAGAFLFLPSAFAFVGPGQQYIVREDLGTLPGHTSSVAHSINSSNQITGQSGTGSSRAFLWTPGSGMVALEPSDKLRAGYGINDAGQVVGSASFLNYAQDGFLWTPQGPATWVVPPSGLLYDDTASAINNLGQIAGGWEDPPYRPYLSTSPAPAKDLGTLGGDMGWALSLNDKTEVVGASYLADMTTKRGFYWSAGSGMKDLGSLAPFGQSEARDINGASQIVGSAQTQTGTHAARWNTPVSGATDLGTLGGKNSSANAINDKGVIVGWSETTLGSSTRKAFRLKPAGTMGSLGTLGGSSSTAHDINSYGHSVGEAQLPNGDTHAVAWWVYTAWSKNQFTCAAVPSGKYVMVIVYGKADAESREYAVENIDVKLLTLGSGEEDDVPVACDPVSGRPMYEIYDYDRDGVTDLVATFDGEELTKRRKLPAVDDQLWLQGALKDRRDGISGIVRFTAN